MNAKISLKNPILIYGSIATLIISFILLLNSPLYKNSALLNFAVTADLVLTIPLIYFLLIRKTDIPNITVVPVMVIGVITGTVLIPAENQQYLEMFKSYVLPLIELCVIGFIVYKVRHGVKSFKKHNKDSADFYKILKHTCIEIVPKKIAPLLTTEISMIYYGFIKWRNPKISQNQFTYHKSGAGIALLIMITFLVLVETFAFHLLLMQWSIIAAWILSGISIYSGLQVFGVLKSLPQRPIEISKNSLHLRYGITNECEIYLDQIQAIALNTNVDTEQKEVKNLSLLGNLEPHNVCIQLKSEYTMERIYGLKQTFSTILLNMDEPERFVKTLKSRLQLK